MNKFLTVVLFFVLVLTASGKEKSSATRLAKVNGMPNATMVNINALSAWYNNNGESERNPATGNSGMSFPRGTSYVVYASGLMIGTLATDGLQNGPRISGFSYNISYTPGAILGIRTGVVESANDPNVRIWRVRRDYAKADLAQDAKEVLGKEKLTLSEIQSVRDQYRKDWAEWPAQKGAPFYDANNDGVYTPQFEMVDGIEVPKKYPLADEPGVANADQVLWYVCNDIPNLESPWKTKSLGLEQQVTIWAYKTQGPANNIIFKKYRLIYKGTAQTPDTARLTEMYLAHWSDPDLGDAGDDYSGCDTTLSLGYSYNSKTLDAEYRKYNLAPPAVGYDFLQGPIVASQGDTAIFNLKKRPGYKNLPMTSFIYFAAGGMYSDPPFTYPGSVQWYQMMRGLPPIPQGPPDPNPLIDPVSGLPTRFWLSGDPITHTGWIDGKIDNPGDRRMLQNSGPFTMALGDTQEIVVGVVAGLGDDYLRSISVMKENDRTVQFIYNTLFEMIPPALSAKVTYPGSGASIALTAITSPGVYTSLNASINGESFPLFDDGTHSDSLANDGIYSNTISIFRSAAPVAIDLSFIDKNGKLITIPKAVEGITTAGDVVVSKAKILFDNINNDGTVNNGEFVHYTFTVQNNSVTPLSGLKAGVTTSTEFFQEYTFGQVDLSSEATVPANNFFTFRVPMNYSESTYPISVLLVDNKGNRWTSEWKFPVVQLQSRNDTIVTDLLNVVGKNDGRVGYVLYNPAMAGGNYEIWYGLIGTTKNWTLVNASDPQLHVDLLPTNELPAIITLPNAAGTALIVPNKAKNSFSYTISVSGLTGPVTSAAIHVGNNIQTGPAVHQILPVGNTMSGNCVLGDSLVSSFIAGNLYMNVKTAANPNGEIRGQIANGMTVRSSLPAGPTSPIPPIFAYAERRVIGFSVYVAPSPIGVKSVRQSAPTVGNVIGNPNPEKSYSIVGPIERMAGLLNESTIEIRFIPGDTNYAMTIPRGVNVPIPTQAKYCSVPFGVFLDTMRVWPIILTSTTDTTWNIDTANGSVNGKPLFDRISGIANRIDGTGNDIRYYQTLIKDALGRNVPNQSNSVKGRILNGANWIVKNIDIVNETADGKPPANGTNIQILSYQMERAGDVKSFTLKTLGVIEDNSKMIPLEYSLAQNYPNPFNPSTRIEFALPRQSNVLLKIYDVVGREVAVLLNEQKNAGNFVAEWNGRNHLNAQVASGVYFYTLRAGNFVQSKKMIFLK